MTGELRHDRSRVLAIHDRVTQLGGEPIKNRGAHQEVPGPRVQRGQDLGGQVIGDLPRTARERLHSLIGLSEVTKP